MSRLFRLGFLSAVLLLAFGLSSYATADAQAGNNLAEGKATSQSTTRFGGNSARAVDGVTNGNFAAGSVTHTANQSESWWQVDLGSVRDLDFVTLYNRTDCCDNRLNNFHVFVSNTPFNSTSLSATQNQSGVSDIAFSGQAGTVEDLSINRSGRYVRIQREGTGVLSLAEVQIIQSGTSFDNVAVGKTASASSQTFGGVPGRAVDGITNGNFAAGSVTHTTREAQPYWEVDLEDLYSLNSLSIFNRTDCCGQRLGDFHVFISDFPFTSTSLTATQNQPGVTDLSFNGPAGARVDFSVNRNGRYIRVQLEDNSQFLALAEVQAFGVLGPPDVQPPSSSVTAPSPGATIESPFQIAGIANDDRGVSSVSMRVRSTGTGEFVQPDGTLSNVPVWLVGDQTVPNGPSVDWTLDISSVPPGTYLITGAAIDTSRNLGPTFQQSVTVVASQTPTVPTGLKRESATSSTITMEWNPSTDDVSVQSYRIYRNGDYIGSSTHPHTTFRDRYLDTSSGYNYTVSAVDGDGNESAQSAAVFRSTTGIAPLTFSEVPDATWNVNGSVNTTMVLGDVVYVGGDFASVSGGGTVLARDNLAAFDRNTGAALPFDPNINGEVHAIDISPDGQTLFVGGNFTTASGVNRKHVAAFNTADGSLSSFHPVEPNSSVRAVATDGETLFIGGTFNNVGGRGRDRLAAYDIATEALRSWEPSANDQVKDIIIDTDRVWIAGNFNHFNGVFARGLVAVDRTTAVSLPVGNASFPVLDITALGDQIFAAGAGPGGRAAAYDRSTGALQWIHSTDGNVQAVDVVGDWAYFGGHYEILSGQEVGRLTRHNITTGVLDTSWLPEFNGIRSIDALAIDDDNLYVGGDFTVITDTLQAGYAQFSRQ